ncbi:hypothetical protein MTP99_000341 [Tenebrio molitor]|nr:hypothetical protein MTP99_000341 [Tenebrio molitor]
MQAGDGPATAARAPYVRPPPARLDKSTSTSAPGGLANWTTIVDVDIPTQVPPLTPGTNKTMAEALKASFASWEKEQVRLNITKDPRQWTENHVAHWLQWAVKEFSLECIPLHQFRMKGKDICAMGKDAFAARAPAFVGDILWEHLEQLQKDVEKERSLPIVGANIYNSMCVPDLNFLDYQGSMLPGEDRKPITITPVPNTTPTPAAPTNNNFLHDARSEPRPACLCAIFRKGLTETST